MPELLISPESLLTLSIHKLGNEMNEFKRFIT